MNRKTTTLHWLFLLCLFSLSSIAQTLTKYDYWIDDDIASMQTGSLSGTEAEVNFQIDASDLSLGVHKISFRVAQSNGYYSAISSLHFFRGITGSDATLEYWFDDNNDCPETIPISVTDEIQEFELDLRNNNLFPIGFHRLNMRAIVNGYASPVYTSHVLKLLAGNPNLLEYWLDGDISGSKTVECKRQDDGSMYVYADNLDLGDVSPGYHRLFWRAVSSSRRTVTAVMSAPIIVKSRYNVEEPEKLTVTEQAYWFDNEEPELYPVAYPENVITQPDKIDVRRLSDGQHTLHTRFGNSAGLWSGVMSQTFIKTKMQEPVINASVSEKEGVVTFEFNSLANAICYKLTRVYPSGRKIMTQRLENTQHPQSLQIIDTPAPGTYTYYVEGSYSDVDNKPQKVKSNEISLTINNVANTLKYGTINGVITHDGKEITNAWFSDYNMLINGEHYSKSDYSFKPSSFGHFTISNIPYGTEISLQVKEDSYSHKPVDIIVSDNTVHNTYRFDGTKTSDDLQPELGAYDLTLERAVTVTPSAWEMTVYNKSEKSWKGNLIVVIVNKKHKEIDDIMESGEGTTLWETAFTPKKYFESRPAYVTTANQKVELTGRKTTVLSLDIIDMPKEDKEEEYIVYVYSQKEGADEMKELQYDGTKPMVVDFNPKNCVITDTENFAAYMKGYAQVLKLLKEYSAWGDPFKLAFGSNGAIQTAFDNYIKSWEKDVDSEELNKDVVDAALKSTGMLLHSFFSDMDDAVKMAEKQVKGYQVVQLHNKIYDLYDKIKESYDAVNADDNHKFFELAKLVLRYSKLEEWANDPVVSVYKTYFEVGEAMAEAAERFANTISHQYLWNRIAEGNTVYNIKVRRSSPSGGHGGYFHGSEYFLEKDAKTVHDGMIERITVELKSPTVDIKEEKVVGNNNVELNNEGITIRNLKFDRGAADGRNEVEAWMVITWRNKRVTYVPLLNEDFVKIENLHKIADNNTMPLIFTVELQSGANQNLQDIANKITFVKP